MLRNYLKIAWRNLWKNKTFSAINIFGLALGIACGLFILLWIQDERKVDKIYKDGSRIYSIYERQYFDGKIEGAHNTPGILADEIKRVIPEITHATGFAWNTYNTLATSDKKMKLEGTYAGADYFSIFSIPLLQGTAQTALSLPESIAISRKTAEKFFGSPEQAIGKTLRFENYRELKVTAVFENLSKHASRKFEYLINWRLFLERNDWAKEWGNNGPHTFIMLRPDADAVALEKKLTHFLDKYNKEQGPNFRIEMGMQRYDEMYLHSQFRNGKISGGRIEYVRLFSIVAVFILLIACINFMNLTTARSIKRAKEIGIRKVVGAARGALIRQFIGEALLVTLLAVILSLLLVSLLLPEFNLLTTKNISLPYSDATFWLNILAITLITGVISGCYPALLLSSFKPVAVLKGKLKIGTGAAWFRKGLVVFQFTLSILLIIGMIVITQQVNYVQHINLGYQKNNLVFINMEGELAGKYNVFKEEALRLPGIKGITHISNRPTEIENGTGGVNWEGKDPNNMPMFTFASVGYDFVKNMQLTLLKGRDFSKAFGTDSVGYIINESALAKIGYKDPIGKPLTMWGRKGTIIGVLKDFHFNSLHVPINSLIVRLQDNAADGYILVRTEAGKTKEALAGLEKLCNQVNPEFPFSHQFADEEYAYLYRSEQVINKLSNYFAFLAIFISCLGLLGLAMFTAQQRTREIGIRKVLGASVGSLFTLLSKEFLLLVGIAFIIASPLAWWAMNNWLQNFVYHIPIYWWVFAIAGIAAVLIALLTVSWQAIKAALANPVKSLRSE